MILFVNSENASNENEFKPGSGRSGGDVGACANADRARDRPGEGVEDAVLDQCTGVAENETIVVCQQNGHPGI